MRILLLLGLAACSGEQPPPAEPPLEAPAAPPPATPEGTAATPASVEMPRVPATADHRLAASHILVSFQGAMNALPNVTRTREEAKARAEEARGKVLAGADFASIAQAYSDDSTGPRGGSLGGFETGTMVKPFEDAVRGLAVGQVSEIVETPFGFHVIRRDALTELHAAHLLVSWQGAAGAPDGAKRDKDAAKARIDEALAKLAGGTPWDEVVRKYSDGPLSEDGGDLGWFARGQLAPQLDNAAFDLDIGATSQVIETPSGFHLLKRLE